jgi:hypothetical protein
MNINLQLCSTFPLLAMACGQFITFTYLLNIASGFSFGPHIFQAETKLNYQSVDVTKVDELLATRRLVLMLRDRCLGPRYLFAKSV